MNRDEMYLSLGVSEKVLAFGEAVLEELKPRFAEIDEISLAKACCACAEIMYSAQPDKQIASEKVGDYSISYSTTQTAVADELIKTASRYLNLRSVGWI